MSDESNIRLLTALTEAATAGANEHGRTHMGQTCAALALTYSGALDRLLAKRPPEPGAVPDWMKPAKR